MAEGPRQAGQRLRARQPRGVGLPAPAGRPRLHLVPRLVRRRLHQLPRHAPVESTNPYGNVALSFVKPGHSTTECANPSGRRAARSRGDDDADQRIAAFGSSTPTLPVTFLACVTAASNVNTVALNISYYGLA